MDTSPPIPEERKRSIQQIIGTFLYYSCAVDCTILPALNTLAEKQSSPTKNTEAAITHSLDYAATNPSAIIRYKASDMILHNDSDASYLLDPRARSRTGGHYYISSLTTDLKKISKPPTTSKWPHPHGMQNPQACGGVRGRRRSRRTVPQCADSGTPKNYFPLTRFYPTTNPNKNRQLRGRRHRHRYS